MVLMGMSTKSVGRIVSWLSPIAEHALAHPEGSDTVPSLFESGLL